MDLTKDLQELEKGIDKMVIIFLIMMVITFIAGLYIGNNSKKPKKKKKNKNPCDCKDVNECEKWCCAKIAYTKAQNYSITEECKHPNRSTVVLDATATCEITIEECLDCRMPLTEPKTDCR
ncbi:hypothetical protein [Flavobacterium sp. N1994]|uniref:hypothetical protein n=1 Tax=Flavobacterium sp. N1994 TaxID=2986827 RepID=UPI002221BB4E|nr:hypothetical protein [Flavobacterium sp. N1994]